MLTPATAFLPYIVILTSKSIIIVDRESGYVEMIQAEKGHINTILKVDVERHIVLHKKPVSTINIKDIGYWTTDGKYHHPAFARNIPVPKPKQVRYIRRRHLIQH